MAGEGRLIIDGGGMNRTFMRISADGRSVFLYAGGEDWIGHLYFNSSNHWTFVGDVDASAQALFDALALITGVQQQEGGGDGG